MKMQVYRAEGLDNWLTCNKCGITMEAELLAEAINDSRDHPASQYVDDFHFSRATYKVLRCKSCYQVTIKRYIYHGNEHYEEHGTEYDLLTYDVEIITSPVKERDYAIPQEIADIANQAERIKFASPRAAFILCRAALEEICRERGIADTKTNSKGKQIFASLNERLNLLFQQLNLPVILQEIMHGIRDLGNEGAHSSQITFAANVSSEEVEVLLELLEYAIEKIYIEPARSATAAEKLNNLRAKIIKNP